MDRGIVYPSTIPLDTDILSPQRNTLIALGALTKMVLGSETFIDGLACNPVPDEPFKISIGQGSLTSLQTLDATAYGSLPAENNIPLVKTGINILPTVFNLSLPTEPGQSITYLIEAAFAEQDTNPVILPYFNAASPSQPYSGPDNQGAAQNTLRTERVSLELKAGVPAITGQQTAPTVDAGYVGLYLITLNYGQEALSPTDIRVYPGAPFVLNKLPSLMPASALDKVNAQLGNFASLADLNALQTNLNNLSNGLPGRLAGFAPLSAVQNVPLNSILSTGHRLYAGQCVQTSIGFRAPCRGIVYALAFSSTFMPAETVVPYTEYYVNSTLIGEWANGLSTLIPHCTIIEHRDKLISEQCSAGLPEATLPSAWL